jgi:hypothetical protein
MLKAIGMSYYLETHAKRAYASGPEAEDGRGQGYS